MDYHSRSKPPAKVWIFPAKWWRHVMHVGKSRCIREILTITFGSFEAVWLIEFSIFFAFFSKKQNKLYTFRFAHASGYPFCSENNLQNQRNLFFFLKILDCQLLLKNHNVTSIEGAMILIQLLMVLGVLLIVNLLNKSEHLHLYLAISINFTWCSIILDWKSIYTALRTFVCTKVCWES